jgi:hypothetical protein
MRKGRRHNAWEWELACREAQERELEEERQHCPFGLTDEDLEVLHGFSDMISDRGLLWYYNRLGEEEFRKHHQISEAKWYDLLARFNGQLPLRDDSLSDRLTRDFCEDFNSSADEGTASITMHPLCDL